MKRAAASAIASRCPDGTAYSTNKIKARAYYELWKRSWTVPEMNGQNTLQTVAQNTFTYGWAAWRQYPKKVEVERTVDGKKVPKIIFDDIYKLVSKIFLNISGVRENLFESLKDRLLSSAGRVPIYLQVNTQARSRVDLVVGNDLFVDPNESLIDDIESLLGEGKISLLL